jgi:phospholipase D1/2
LYVDIPESFDEWVPDSALLDPEKPIEPNEMFDYFVDPEQQKPLYRRFLRISLLLLVVFGLVAMWALDAVERLSGYRHRGRCR